MPTTIALLNQKGGAGKTTLATNLAAAAHLGGTRTLLVDMDAQGSALDWGMSRAEPSRLDGLVVVKNDRALALSRLREMAVGFGVVVLDGPPGLKGDARAIQRSAALLADVVVVPIQTSGFDVWAVDQTRELLDEADEERRCIDRAPMRRLFLSNRADARTKLARNIQAIDELEICCVVQQRVVFPEASWKGESVLTLEPQGAAALEIRRLWRIIRPATLALVGVA